MLPLSKKHARRILGRYFWALRPNIGYAPFLSGWWAHCQWGEKWVQNCPLSLLTSLLHCLIVSLRGRTPKSLLPLSVCGGGLIFVDTGFDIDRFKVGIWGPVLGGRVFHGSPFVKTQHEAQLEALVRGVRLCINVGWPVWRLAGGNESALSQVSALRAGAGLERQNGHLRRLFYLLECLESSIYLEYVTRDLKDSLSRVDSDWGGGVQTACQEAGVRFKALEAYPDVPSPVWILGFPKGRRGAASNLEHSALGFAQPLCGEFFYVNGQ